MLHSHDEEIQVLAGHVLLGREEVKPVLWPSGLPQRRGGGDLQGCWTVACRPRIRRGRSLFLPVSRWDFQGLYTSWPLCYPLPQLHSSLCPTPQQEQPCPSLSYRKRWLYLRTLKRNNFSRLKKKTNKKTSLVILSLEQMIPVGLLLFVYFCFSLLVPQIQAMSAQQSCCFLTAFHLHSRSTFLWFLWQSVIFY